MEKFTVFNIQRFSVNDGPGIRTAVFFKGCPLHCAWCHNPESQSAFPELSFIEEKCTGCGACATACKNQVHEIKSSGHLLHRDRCTGCGACSNACVFSALELFGKRYTCDEIIAEILRDEVFYGGCGGVTFSGGEPFMQGAKFIDLLKKCKARKLHVCIETSGATTKNLIISAAPYTDLFLFDFKHFDYLEHKRYTGADIRNILDNLTALDGIGANVVLRCPIIPGVNDTVLHLKKIAECANGHSSVKAIELLPYHPLGISKRVQIGKSCEYSNPDFLDKSAASEYVNYISTLTDKSVKLG